MCEIEYKTGMQQGDNMTPILFLCIMQAAIESLHTKLTCNKLEFCYAPNRKSSTCQYGRLALQPKPKTTKGDAFQIDDLLYVDDGTFLFLILTEMKKATQTIHDHFSKFGLQMHIGSTSAKSKTEAMFFPSSLTQAESQKTLPKNFDLNN